MLYILPSCSFWMRNHHFLTWNRYLPTIQSISSMLSPYSPWGLLPRKFSVVIRGVCTCRKDTKRRKGPCLFLKVHTMWWELFFGQPEIELLQLLNTNLHCHVLTQIRDFAARPTRSKCVDLFHSTTFLCLRIFSVMTFFLLKSIEKSTLMFYFSAMLRHVGSQLPDQGSNPCPLQWELRVLTTGPPGNSLHTDFIRLFLPDYRFSFFIFKVI